MNARDMLRIASNARHLRQEYGYTQSEIADKLHVSRSTYSLIESGKRVLSTDLVLALTDLYHVNADTILSLDSSHFIKNIQACMSTDDKIDRLNQLFLSLSAFSQGCLIERAEALYEEEQRTRSED